MFFTQFYLACLCQASCLIGDETTGQAVVVDHRCDVGEYVADALSMLVGDALFIGDVGRLDLVASIGFSVLTDTE